jgi:hypothetical protein
MSRMTKRAQNICLDCRDTWYPRGRGLSNKCPSCGSPRVSTVSVEGLKSLVKILWFTVRFTVLLPVVVPWYLAKAIARLSLREGKTPEEEVSRSPKRVGVQAVSFGVLFVGALIGLSRIDLLDAPASPAATKKVASVTPSPARLAAAPPGVNIQRACDAWGLDSEGKAFVARRLAKTDTVVVLGSDDRSTAILLDGEKRWVPNACLKSPDPVSK